jgi:hypothetical protein
VRHRRKQAGSFVIILLPALFLGGCFHTREPQNPTDGQEGPDYLAFDQPVNVLLNIQTAFNARDPSGYRNTLVPDTLRFEAATGDQNICAGVAENWNTAQENTVFTTVFSSQTSRVAYVWAPVPTAGLGKPDPDHPGDSKYEWFENVHYEATFTKKDFVTVVIASGYVDLYMIENSENRWAMRKWVDRSDGSAHVTLGSIRCNGGL